MYLQKEMNCDEEQGQDWKPEQKLYHQRTIQYYII